MSHLFPTIFLLGGNGGSELQEIEMHVLEYWYMVKLIYTEVKEDGRRTLKETG